MVGICPARLQEVAAWWVADLAGLWELAAGPCPRLLDETLTKTQVLNGMRPESKDTSRSIAKLLLFVQKNAKKEGVTPVGMTQFAIS